MQTSPTAARVLRGGWSCALLVACGLATAACDDLDASGTATASRELDRDGLMDLGRKVYGTNCLTCHQFDGGGVPGLQPGLVDSALVVGDPKPLVELVWLGIGDPNSPGALPATGEYGQIMNGFSHLSEEEIAAVVTYIRGGFGNDASEVSVADVRRIVRPLAGTAGQD